MDMVNAASIAGKGLRHPGRDAVFVFALLLTGSSLRAQISPGELAAPHAQLEGMGNCTQCHTLGQKVVPNAKCLACHTQIQTRMAAGTGYHARLKQKECVECHKDHNGRNFLLVRLDTRSFDHSTVGYPLEGRHAHVECVKCHTREHIKAPDVLNDRKLMGGRTYLGLGRECLACHTDVHRGQLSTQCLSCHSMDGWKPSSKFSHDRARFRLTGRHVPLQCGACHKQGGNANSVVRYVGLEFSTCSSCHGDPHNGKFSKPCASCHTTNGWEEGATRNFDHASTRFPLRGRHAKVACERCHLLGVSSGTGRKVQVFTVRKFDRCTDCHEDAHRGEFASRSDHGECSSCHTEGGYSPARFDHTTARYVLEGKHQVTECRKCHGTVTTDARGKRIPPDYRVKSFSRCADCHEDGHAGQFAARKDGGACETCHSVRGFLPANYTLDDHRQARFLLTGGHVAVPCEKCHPANTVKAKSTWRFRWEEVPTCVQCHKDIHRGQFRTLMTNGCATCHSTERWTLVRFSHDATRFPLRGKHVEVPCNRCHKLIAAETLEERVQYSGTPIRCADCHANAEVSGSKAERVN